MIRIDQNGYTKVTEDLWAYKSRECSARIRKSRVQSKEKGI